MVVNWGNARPFRYEDKCRFINKTRAVEIAGNKLLCFSAMEKHGVSVVPWSRKREEVRSWQASGRDVVCRHKLRGHSGDGIQIVSFDADIPECPLYTCYIKKSAEYRIHVFGEEIIDVQQKRKRGVPEGAEVEERVRSIHNGWVYCRSEVFPPEKVVDAAHDAVEALGLDFGAVDVIWNKKHNKAYVLEVNTAPGLQGSTTQVYADAIRRYCG